MDEIDEPPERQRIATIDAIVTATIPREAAPSSLNAIAYADNFQNCRLATSEPIRPPAFSETSG
jgi:hypothetical protein